jgi:hypothetical protein
MAFTIQLFFTIAGIDMGTPLTTYAQEKWFDFGG